MFQFTTTSVINTKLDSNGVTPKYVGSAEAFKVARVGTFKADNIVSVYKRDYSVGVEEEATVVVPTVTAGRVARLEIDVRLSGSANTEYANTHLYFRKPVVVEVIATGAAATDAEALVEQINKLQNRFGESYVKADNSGATITVTAKEDTQRFHSIKVYQEPEDDAKDYTYIDKNAEFTVTKPGKKGFGDDAYMISSIVVPTVENSKAFGVNAEERPVLGGNYTQFTLRYEIDKDSEDGILSGLKSVTTHVFYVTYTLASEFETEIKKAFSNVESVTDTPAEAEVDGN